MRLNIFHFRNTVVSKIAAAFVALFLNFTPLAPALAQEADPSAFQQIEQTQDTIATNTTEATQSTEKPATDTTTQKATSDAVAPESGEPTPESLLNEPQPDPTFGTERQSLSTQLKIEPDQFDGSLRYEYPLTLPPGRNGMAPGLSLTYSSNNKEQISPFGYGWSINIPYIERMNKRGAHKMYARNDFYSSLDGELAATSTGGAGGSMAMAYFGEETVTAAPISDGSSFSSQLEGKSAAEKADIKADAILNAYPVGIYVDSAYGLRIEIESLYKMEGGVEVFARAWRGEKQLGFGPDGSVEIERFRIINPPIMVPDGTAHLEKVPLGNTGRTIELEVTGYKEDPAEALRQTLAHTIHLVGQENTPIVKDKIGFTTSVFYPSAGSVAPADGAVEYASNSVSWSTAQTAGTGTSANTTDTVFGATDLGAMIGVNRWSSGWMIGRSIANFDTSSLPDTDSIASAYVSFYHHGKSNNKNTGTDTIIITTATPASTSTIATADYDTIGDIDTPTDGALAAAVDLSAITTSAYNDYALNATGKNYVSKTGPTSIGIRIGDDQSTSPSGWADSDFNLVNTRAADYTGTTNDPKLVVSHSAPVGTSGYGALVENGDFRVYEFDDITRWKMTDKGGSIYMFGSTTASRIDNTASSTQIFRWMLDEARDRNNNFISYEYYEDNDQLYPSAVTYTGHGSTDGIYEIEFVRESRSDIATSSAPGFPITSKYRINEIRVKVNGITKRSYALGYGTGDNGRRSLLTSITESGIDDSGATTTLPAVSFAYSTKQANWTHNSSWVMPVAFVDDFDGVDADWGARFDDFNGDGWTDILKHRGSDADNGLYFGLGDGTWSTTTPTGTNELVSLSGQDRNVRVGDVDGDSRADFISGAGSKVGINTNRGGSFVEGTDWTVPISFVDTGGVVFDIGGRAADVNGDGLMDLLKSFESGGYAAANGIYLNNGSGWDATSTNPEWNMPSGVYFAGAYDIQSGVDFGTQIADFNGDGLTDLLKSREYGSPPYSVLYLNDGDGTWTEVVPSGVPGTFASASGADQGRRVADVNADGLPDIVEVQGSSGGTVYLNLDGKAFTASASWGDIVPDFVVTGLDRGARFVDIDADGIPDIARSYAGSSTPAGQNGAYLGNGVVPDLLTTVTVDAGGMISASYKPSSQYVSGGAEQNPLLPMVIQTVDAIGMNDGFGTVGTTTYTYGGGEYYYANEFDRKLAGFATTTITDPASNVTKVYAHQGNGSQSSIGEYSDSKSKIGKPYRTEMYDSSNNLYSKKIDKWESAALSNGREFIKKTRTTEFAYDGDSDHRDVGTTFAYDDTSGNLSGKTENGEVSGSDDGSYTDSGSDTRTTVYAYATSTTYGIYRLPMSETVKNNSGTQVAARNFFYDSLAAGSVEKGNLTKEERWITGSTYASTTKAYNTYGLLTSETDPRSKTTTFSYESANMYVGTTTNPVGHITETYRDLSSGKPKKVVDPNGLSFETVFDGLDRVTSEKIPDHLGTPTNTVTKTAYAYTDTSKARRVQKTDYLNSATSTDTYIYFDGFLRPIQERRKAESSNTYVVRNSKYDARGDLSQESLPYEDTGTSRSAMTANADLLITYGYDPLRRATSTINTEGTETYSYDQWKKTITDREANIKDLTTDAYGNLSQVDEHNATSTYTTTYTYDALNNLTRITDALSNLRNFAYDGLSRLMSAEDLHASGDSTYGTRSFDYDLSGNVASTTDAKSQTIEYAYDDINRSLTENYTGAAGTEISYGYDTCTYGKGRLCSATTTDAVTNLAYDALGNVSSESRTIDGTAYATTYTRDRLNNLTVIVYPNSREARYGYNGAGQLEEILTKPSGGSFSTVISDFDYSPNGQVSYKRFGNDVETTYTFDAAELYRLKRIDTNVVGQGGDMESVYLPEPSGLAPPAVEVPIPDLHIPDLADLTNNESPDPASPAVADELSSEPAVEDLQILEPFTDNPVDGTSDTASSTTTPGLIEPEIMLEEVLIDADMPISTSTPDISTSTFDVLPESATTTATTSVDNVIPDAAPDIELASATSTATSTPESQIPDLAFVPDPDSVGEYLDEKTVLRIEIQKVNEIDGGIEVFAHAWRGDKPVGFGSDGSVELERFRFFGISPFVEDPEGPYEQVYTVKDRTEENPAGLEREVRTRYSSDPLKALRMQLADTMRLVANGADPTPGKIGNTTSTFYPDANPETSTVDGFTARDTGGVSWTSLRTGAAQAANDSAALSSDGTLIQFASGSNWYYLGRAIFLFNTSPIGTDTVSSATFSVVASSKTDNATLDAKFNLTAMTPASDTAIATGDYLNYGDTTYATEVDLGSITTDGTTYNDWTLNSSGRAAISGSGNTKLGLRLSADISNTQPSFPSAGEFSAMGMYYADQAGTTKDPKLVIVHTAATSSTPAGSIQSLAYTYDKVGNITALTDYSTSTGKIISFGYDDLNRLTSASTTAASSTPFSQTYSYSSIGNVTNKSDVGDYAYAGTSYANPHAATTINGVTYSYDNNGNLTDYGNWDFSWDWRDRLTQVATGTATTTHGYDHLNQRAWQRPSTNATTTYPNKYYTVSGATSTAYIFAGDMLVAYVEGNGAATSTYYVHPDHLGSTHAITNASGTVISIADYYPYGSKRIDSSPNLFDRQFIGERFDSSTDLNYLNARYLQSSRGQFLSQDPVFWEVGITQDGRNALTNPQALNSYSYAYGNPITNKDPQGRCPWCLPFLIGAAAGGTGLYINDILENRAQGLTGWDVYAPRSSWQEYNAAVGSGAAVAATAVFSLPAAGVVAVGGSAVQDRAGGRNINLGRGVVTGGVTVATGGVFRGLAGPSPAESFMQATGKSFSSVSSAAMRNEVRYVTSGETFTTSVNSIVQNNMRSNPAVMPSPQPRPAISQTTQPTSSGGGGVSGLISKISALLGGLWKP